MTAANQLRAARQVTVEQITALHADFDEIVAGAQLVATDDEHDPEGATIAFERSRVDALLHQAREQLADIDRAQRRVATGRYGRCEHCRRPIATERLAALPATTTCIDCASQRRRERT